MKLTFRALGLLFGASVVIAIACSSNDDSKGSQSASADVTPAASATIALSDGASLNVPVGSVTQNATLQLSTVSTDNLVAAVPANTNAGQPIAFTPHAFTFAQTVTVTLPAVAGADQVLRLDNEQDTTWEVVEGATFANGIATFQTTHFCIYMTAKSAQSTGTGGASSGTGGVTASGGVSTATGGVGIIAGGTTATSGGTTATSGGTTATSGGSSTATGGKSGATGGTTGSTTPTFCPKPDTAALACYTAASASSSSCASSISACCAESTCNTAINCTIANKSNETSCRSGLNDNGATLYNAVKSCVMAINSCPFAATAVTASVESLMSVLESA
jgi:hypothetical protein